MKRVCIFDKEVCVQQFVRIFVRINCGRLGAAKMNRVLAREPRQAIIRN
jgi:hypothetical protein